MLSLSEKIIRHLTEITTAESAPLQQCIDKKFVADCIIPPLAGENNVHCNIAVVAPVSAGKSTLFNALGGYPILPVASKTTSAAPTYITRVKEQSQESVTVYGIKKEETLGKDGNTSTRFWRDDSTKRTYYAKDISKKMFEELFEYMYFVTHGTDLEYKITIENVAYFMKTEEKSDFLFHGEDDQKRTISKEDFALTYDTPRHRFLLLLILLCVYVDQNDSEKSMSEYTKEVNRRRTELFKKYKFPISSDYCVCLDWCSEDIPENVTLIDLPGTGSSTEDVVRSIDFPDIDVTENTATQSSHTKLVRGILMEADALWVLCSEDGTTDPDLLSVLEDVIVGNSRKNKVCIYNCRNKKPNDSGPVIDFLKKLPCLTGERCYVVDALAGEYKYAQSGVNALLTKNASDKRYNDDEEPTETEMIKKLGILYNGDRKAYCTFTTSKDAAGNIIVVQDSGLKYTLDTFFKNALSDYIERLKYEVALKQTLEQARFYVQTRESLFSSRSILEGINGKGEEISKAVDEALTTAKNQALDNYIKQMTKHQADMKKKLDTLGNTVGEKLKAKFLSSLSSLIENIKTEWKTLEKTGHPNCLKANWWGNYPLKVDHPNWGKFQRVRESARNKITIAAFDEALKIADLEIKKYNDLLNSYTDNLKKVTRNFASDYINAFLSSFDKKRDELCKKRVTDELYKNFNSTREKLKEALQGKLNVLCDMVCNSFDVLTEHNGIFDQLCRDTDKNFRNRFNENILDGIRKFMYDTFTGTNYIGWICDHMKPEDLHRILNNDFSSMRNTYTEKLSRLIDAIYGMNVDDANFPADLSAKVTKFNGDKVVNGAVPDIEKMHSNISSLVGFGADIVVDLTKQIEEINAAISTWAGIGEQYENIYKILEDSEAENTKKLYNDCTNEIETIISKAKG